MIRGFHTFDELRMRFPKLQSNSETWKENVFVSVTLPSKEEFVELHKYYHCLKCRNRVSLVASDLNENCGALMVRCRSCFEDQFLFITKEHTTSPDICIFQMSPKLNTTQSLFDGFKCPSCQKSFQCITVDTTAYDIKTIIATHLRCNNCEACMNIVFWDHPLNYFQYSIKMGDCVRRVSPFAALVFYVSALENYLQKAFLSASSFNKYLVQKRRVNFQNLKEANELFNEYFNLKLDQIAGSDWQKMIDTVKKRNMIVHNAGHDKDFNLINVDDSVIEDVRKTICTFVDSALRPELRKKYID